MDIETFCVCLGALCGLVAWAGVSGCKSAPFVHFLWRPLPALFWKGWGEGVCGSCLQMRMLYKNPSGPIAECYDCRKAAIRRRRAL